MLSDAHTLLTPQKCCTYTVLHRSLIARTEHRTLNTGRLLPNWNRQRTCVWCSGRQD